MTVSFVGSGNVATHMAQAFYAAGFTLLEICSRNFEHASALAGSVHASAQADVKLLQPADLLIISVKDDAISTVAEELPVHFGLVVHTSGSIPVSILQKFNRSGVLYPLQTFSRSRKVDFKAIPLCIEGSDESALQAVKQLAGKLSHNVSEVDSVQRRELHLAAVFACNFSNHLYAIAESLVNRQGLSFDLMRPLIMETAAKIANSSPASVQTGPAVRGDERVLKAHEQMLEDQGDLKELYHNLSKSIKKLHS